MLNKFEIGDVVYRHGDVLLKKTELASDGGPTMAQAVLHKGDNHSHDLSGEFRIFEKDDKKYFIALGPTVLTHEEHGQINFEAMTTALEVAIQLEYDHFLEEARQVQD